MKIAETTNRLGKALKGLRKKKATKVESQDAIIETVACECPCKDLPAGDYFRRISEKAYELYQKRGCVDGYDQDDWFEAERLVTEELNKIF